MLRTGIRSCIPKLRVQCNVEQILVLSSHYLCYSKSVFYFSERTQLLEHYELFAICYTFQPFRQSSGRFYNVYGMYAEVEAYLHS